MSEKETLAVVDKIDAGGGLVLPQLAHFMLECCDLIRPILPLSASEALDVARHYWNGKATVNEIEAARIRCWEYIDKKPEDAAVCGTRAVLCLLYPTLDPDDGFGVIHFFLALANRADDHWAEQQSLLEKQFAEILSK